MVHTAHLLADLGDRRAHATFRKELGWRDFYADVLFHSFLVKDLHLPWRWGARHFMQQLVDGDLASNQHGWQWTAGTGTDPAPYSRVFNPTSQGPRFDPKGDYTRRWVPELAGLSADEIHTPSSGAVGLPPGVSPPMVDHAAERVEALRRYREVAGR